MSAEDLTAEQAFAAVVEALGDTPGVIRPEPPGASARRFGSTGLRVQGRIFAMVTRGHLVLKMPASRVKELIAAGAGGPFDAGKGKPMAEWVSLEPLPLQRCLELAREALAFVSRSAS